eukprot:g8414.t1
MGQRIPCGDFKSDPAIWPNRLAKKMLDRDDDGTERVTHVDVVNAAAAGEYSTFYTGMQPQKKPAPHVCPCTSDKPCPGFLGYPNALWLEWDKKDKGKGYRHPPFTLPDVLPMQATFLSKLVAEERGEYYLTTVWFGTNEAAYGMDGGELAENAFVTSMSNVIGLAAKRSKYTLVIFPPMFKHPYRLFGVSGWPTLFTPPKLALYKEYLSAVRSKVDELGPAVSCLDIDEAIGTPWGKGWREESKDMRNTDQSHFDMDTVHFSPKGNEAIAHLVYRKLQAMERGSGKERKRDGK